MLLVFCSCPSASVVRAPCYTVPEDLGLESQLNFRWPSINAFVTLWAWHHARVSRLFALRVSQLFAVCYCKRLGRSNQVVSVETKVWWTMIHFVSWRPFGGRVSSFSFALTNTCRVTTTVHDTWHMKTRSILTPAETSHPIRACDTNTLFIALCPTAYSARLTIHGPMCMGGLKHDVCC